MERCQYCKRVLKDPTSMVAGAGPVCREKHGLAVRVVKVTPGVTISYADAGDFW